MSVPYLTICTPTYNRSFHLASLYESIKEQDFSAFEWVIIDDGSTDGTAGKVKGFIAENRVDIRYKFQANAGKHVAINNGVEMARGELFFIVDSDDTLVGHALSTIVGQWKSVLELPNAAQFAGVCGLRIYKNGSVIGGSVDYDILDVSAIDYRFKLGYKGDRAEVIKTSIMACYPYPQIPGERFCADAVVWNRIAKSYLLRFFNSGIYVCEYLPGGITDTSVRLRQLSPQGTSLYYAEMACLPGLTAWQRLKAVVNFWRFAVYDNKEGWSKKMKKINSLWSLLVWPICYLLMRFDKWGKPPKES